jgi:putative sterol carrier protein
MLALKNTFDRDAARFVRIVAEVHFATDTFQLIVDDGTIDIARGPAVRPDVTIETDPQTLEELAFGGLALDDAEGAGRLRVAGERGQLPRLFSLFRVPTAAG